MDDPDPLVVLRALVEAHAQAHPRTGAREPILYSRAIGGSSLNHHALDEPPPKVDDALLEEMQLQGMIDIDYLQHSWNLVPTALGRRIIQEQDRISSEEPVADVTPLVTATAAQAEAGNKFAWPAVRPVLAALRRYWEEAGFSEHGVQVLPLIDALPDEQHVLFAATLRELVAGEYLVATSTLGASLSNDLGQSFSVPTEVAVTERAHTVLDGWPGAGPEELVENLLAVLLTAAATETDPARKGRLERLIETIREVGVATAGEVLSKVLLGL